MSVRRISMTKVHGCPSGQAENQFHTGGKAFQMKITWAAIVVWLIVGALAGSLAGMVIKRSKEGFGRVANIGIGLVGALVGGFFFKIFNINLGLRNIVVSFEELVAAFLGSLLFLLVLLLVRKYPNLGLKALGFMDGSLCSNILLPITMQGNRCNVCH